MREGGGGRGRDRGRRKAPNGENFLYYVTRDSIYFMLTFSMKNGLHAMLLSNLVTIHLRLIYFLGDLCERFLSKWYLFSSKLHLVH